MSFIHTNYMFSKKEAFKAMMICFDDTKKTYLSYGDFHFLLHKNGKIGQTTPREKKKMYQQWQKQLKATFVHTGWPYPYRKFVFESSRFKEITDALVKDKKLKKVRIKKKPCYCLYEKIDMGGSISQIRQQKIIDDCSVFNMHNTFAHHLIKITYYGVPIAHPPTYRNLKTYKFVTKLDKLVNKFEKPAIEFMSIMRELTTFIINDIIDEIKNGFFEEIDKKLAFLYLEQFYSSNEKTDFIWTGEGKILEYLPKKYIIDSKVSDLLHYFVEFESFWVSKLIVIDPAPEIKQLRKSRKDLLKTKKTIKQYLDTPGLYHDRISYL